MDVRFINKIQNAGILVLKITNFTNKVNRIYVKNIIPTSREYPFNGIGLLEFKMVEFS